MPAPADGMFSIERFAPGVTGVADAYVRIDPSHAVFAGHFPGRPIVPGVITVRMALAIATRTAGVPLRLVTARSIKFLAPVDPRTSPILHFTVRLSPMEALRSRLEVQAATDHGTVFKMIAEVAHDRPPMNASDVMSRSGTCVVMATYNNAGTLGAVLEGVTAIAGNDVIVVDDGSTDATGSILVHVTGITILRNERNRGKGFSLKRAFREAYDRGYRHAITIDSDGQHDPGDIHALLRAIEEQPGAMVMGARDMEKGGAPRRSTFGNRFSNFWFLVETGIRLPDTQTGFRAYPLEPLSHARTISTRFGYEVEAIVKLAWRGVPFAVVPVGVRYDQPGRVSHFRPFTDFFHVSVLNSWLVIAALFWYWPRRIFSLRKLWRTIRDEAVKHEESSVRKAVAIGFGLFMGILPIWGFQLLTGIALSILFRLNKVLFVTAAHISIPPMVPVVIYASFRMGALYRSDAVSLPLTEVSFEAISLNVAQYVQGAIILAILAGLVGFFVSWPVIRLLRGR